MKKHQYGRSILNTPLRVLTDRYRGKGRPRKSDYDDTTITKMQRQLNFMMNQKVDKL